MTVELKIANGEYVPDGAGGLCRLGGEEEVLARVLYRLTARRGGLPFLPQLGSRLHLILREKPSARRALAVQYVREALEEETDIQLAGVELADRGEQAELTVRLNWRGEDLAVTVDLT